MIPKKIKIAPVFNDGIVSICHKIQKKDKFNTPIRGVYETEEIMKSWYNLMGVTAQDTYFANADGKHVTSKIMIRGKVRIDPTWSVKLDGKDYEIYRSYYNAKDDGTEITLTEVSK